MQISTIYWPSDLFISALIFFFLAAIFGFANRYTLSKELEDFIDLGLKIFLGTSALLLTISFIWFLIDNPWIIIALFVIAVLFATIVPKIREKKFLKLKQVQTE